MEFREDIKDPCEECIVKVCCGGSTPCSEYLYFVIQQRRKLNYFQFKKRRDEEERN